MLLVLKGYAKRNLLRAYQLHKISELLKVRGLPYKTYTYGKSAIAFEFGVEKEGWHRNIKRQKLSGEVQAIIDLELAIWELETGGNYSGGELGLRYEIQEFSKTLTPEKINEFKEMIKERLKELMVITEEKDRWEPLPRPEIVPFSEVFDNYFTPEYVAKILKIERERVIAWCREGKIKAIKVGKKWRILEEELQRFIQGLANYEKWCEEPLE